LKLEEKITMSTDDITEKTFELQGTIPVTQSTSTETKPIQNKSSQSQSSPSVNENLRGQLNSFIDKIKSDNLQEQQQQLTTFMQQLKAVQQDQEVANQWNQIMGTLLFSGQSTTTEAHPPPKANESTGLQQQLDSIWKTGSKSNTGGTYQPKYIASKNPNEKSHSHHTVINKKGEEGTKKDREVNKPQQQQQPRHNQVQVEYVPKPSNENNPFNFDQFVKDNSVLLTQQQVPAGSDSIHDAQEEKKKSDDKTFPKKIVAKKPLKLNPKANEFSTVQNPSQQETSPKNASQQEDSQQEASQQEVPQQEVPQQEVPQQETSQQEASQKNEASTVDETK